MKNSSGGHCVELLPWVYLMLCCHQINMHVICFWCSLHYYWNVSQLGAFKLTFTRMIECTLKWLIWAFLYYWFSKFFILFHRFISGYHSGWPYQSNSSPSSTSSQSDGHVCHHLCGQLFLPIRPCKQSSHVVVVVCRESVSPGVPLVLAHVGVVCQRQCLQGDPWASSHTGCCRGISHWNLSVLRITTILASRVSVYKYTWAISGPFPFVMYHN